MRFSLFPILLMLVSCAGEPKPVPVVIPPKDTVVVKHDTVPDSLPSPVKIGALEQQLIDAGLVDVRSVDSSIHVNLRYSDTDNFLLMDVYGDLHNCYLQRDVADKVSAAQHKLKEKHADYSLYIFDGVRPLHIQQIMWDTIDVPIKERTKYLSNPDPKKGSLHNYGAAVDLSICDENGILLDMGTDFDYFGELAYPVKEQVLLDSGLLTKKQIDNRKLLRSVMYSAGFFGIQTEWWHFNSITRDSASKIYAIVP